MIRVQVRRRREVLTVAADQGSTIDELVAYLTANSLTGSAVTLDDAEVRADDGTTFRFGDVKYFLQAM